MTPEAIRQVESQIDSAMEMQSFDQAESLAAVYLAGAGPIPLVDAGESPGFRSRYIGAQVLLANGRLNQALDRLIPLQPILPHLPRDLAGRVWLLFAETLARLGRLAEVPVLLTQVPDTLLQSDIAQQLRWLRVRMWLGEVLLLQPELRACEDRLAAAQDIANQVLLLCDEGLAWDAAGNLARAAQAWEAAEKRSRALGPGVHRTDALIQLARLDHLRGHLAAALDGYDSALTEFATPGQALEIRLRRLLVSLDICPGDQIQAEISQALDEIDPGSCPEELVPLVNLIRTLTAEASAKPCSEEAEAYGLAAAGDVAAARWLYRQALQATASPERQARLALALGLLALAERDREESLSWLRRAEELARQQDLPEVLGRALQGRGRIASELDQNDEAARPLLEEAAQVFDVQANQFASIHEALRYRHQKESTLRSLLHGACRRGDAQAVFAYQEIDRGRFLLDLWHSTQARPGREAVKALPRLEALQQEIAVCEACLASLSAERESAPERRELLRRWEQLHTERDRLLEGFLRDRKRRGSSALPVIGELRDLHRTLPADAVYVAPAVFASEIYLLVVRSNEPGRVVPVFGSTTDVLERIGRLRDTLTSQLERYRQGRTHPGDRQELDDVLAAIGHGPLGVALLGELYRGPERPRRLIWVPDGPLHGLPVPALRWEGRYLIEEVEVVQTFSGSLWAHQARVPGRLFPGWRRAVLVSEAAHELPDAEREASLVAATFWRSRHLHGPEATRARLRRYLATAQVVHFACHADFDPERPLSAFVQLPSGERIHAPEWLEEAVRSLPLVTLSACRSAAVGSLQGSEVFGLVTGLLAAGVGAVVAGYWPVADRESVALMERFYQERLRMDLASALAQAQRAMLSRQESSPLFWATFALFGNPRALRGRSWLSFLGIG